MVQLFFSYFFHKCILIIDTPEKKTTKKKSSCKLYIKNTIKKLRQIQLDATPVFFKKMVLKKIMGKHKNLLDSNTR